jgi:hypothetical protein
MTAQMVTTDYWDRRVFRASKASRACLVRLVQMALTVTMELLVRSVLLERKVFRAFQALLALTVRTEMMAPQALLV